MKTGMTGGMQSARALLAGCLLAGLLVGCGQKGPLYLPEDDAVTEQAEAGAPAANAAESTDPVEQAGTADR